MEDLPRHAATHLTRLAGFVAMAAAALAAGVVVLGSGAARATEVDLVGTWHVLVHYTDDHTAHPDTMRWEDRVWVFEPAGSRLRWSDYPIVVFSEKKGRFEALGGSRASRVLHAWEPNGSQQAQIASGLEVNPRGMKSKTLRGSDSRGWRTHARATPASASVVTYTENWSITGMPEMPVFERVDALGSGRSESLDGITRFTALEVDPGGQVLRGTFERDESRRGTFRMTLAGNVGDVQGSGKSQGERVYELFFGEAGAALFKGDGLKAIQQQSAAGEEIPEDVRAEIRENIRGDLERSLRRRGLDPADYQSEIESLSKQIEKQIVDEGRSPDEIGRMIEEGRIAP